MYVYGCIGVWTFVQFLPAIPYYRVAVVPVPTAPPVPAPPVPAAAAAAAVSCLYRAFTAAIGGTSLVNNVKTDNCKQFSKSIFLVGKIEASTCPSGGKDSMSVTIPVPNISGQASVLWRRQDAICVCVCQGRVLIKGEK